MFSVLFFLPSFYQRITWICVKIITDACNIKKCVWKNLSRLFICFVFVSLSEIQCFYTKKKSYLFVACIASAFFNQVSAVLDSNSGRDGKAPFRRTENKFSLFIFKPLMAYFLKVTLTFLAHTSICLSLW